MNQEQNSSHSLVYLTGNGQKEGQFVLSAESISELTGLFDEFKIKTAQGSVVDLSEVRNAIRSGQ